MRRLGRIVWKAARGLSPALNLVGLFMIVVLTCSTIVDVTGRYLFDSPLTGTLEVNELALAMLVFMSLAYTQRIGGHVSVDVVVLRLPPRVQHVLRAFTGLVGAVLFGLLAWRGVLLAVDSWHSGQTTAILLIPVYIFRFLLPLAAVAVVLELVMDSLAALRRLRGK